MEHLTLDQLHAGLPDIRNAPRDGGAVKLIVRRPDRNVRETLTEAELSLTDGLSGDSWRARGNSKRPDGSADPECQLTLMNARAIALVAREPERWPLAGDQFFVDLDLSGANLPAGTRLQLGTALIEVSAKPHTGCGKFVERFGADAMRFVNSPLGRELNLRGINARVVQPGTVRLGDTVRRA